MFKSELSGTQYGRGVKPVRVVIQTRPREYYEDGVLVGRGHEIVRELLVGQDEVNSITQEGGGQNG